MKDNLSVYQQEQIIINKIKTFIDAFDNGSKITVDFFGGNHYIKNNEIKKRDYLSSIIKKIENCQEILNEEVKNRATGTMLQKIITVNDDLDYILNQINPHREIGKKNEDNTTHIINGKKLTMAEDEYQFYKPLLNKEVDEINGLKFDDVISLFASGKTAYIKNQFNMEDFEAFVSFSKKDIFLLGYYELIYMYKQNGITYDFKTKALKLLKYKFNYSLEGNNLAVSLVKIRNKDFSLEICENQLKELKEKNKIIYPAFTTSF